MAVHLRYSRSKFFLLYFGLWLFWAGLTTLILHRLNLSWEFALIDAFFSCFLLAFFGLAMFIVYRFYQPGKSNYTYFFLLGTIQAILYCFILQWLLNHSIIDPVYNDFLTQSIPLRFAFALLVISFITLLSWLVNRISDQEEKEKHQGEIENMLKEAELAKLRQQLQPHLLFNSLNSISALVATKPNDARKMIQQLSDFLRGTLKKDDNQLVPFKEELEHLKLYLEIEKVRFGHRLNIEINTDEASLEKKLPPLLLQPIVENAIKFGLYDITDDVTITISSTSNTKELMIDIRNPFDPATQKQGTGFGLSSVQRRLYLLYMRNDLLSTTKQDDIFTTTLKIPQVQ